MILESIFIGIGTGVVANYLKDAADKPLDVAKSKSLEQWEKFKWAKAAKRYRDSLDRQHAEIRILGKSNPIPLAGIFTDAYILDEVTARQRFDIESLKKQYPDRLHRRLPDRVKGLELVTQPEHRRLYILGKPGAGKTTFLKYLTVQGIQGKLDRIPIFISLKEWSGSNLDLMAFIAKQFEICNFPKAEQFIRHMLGDGKALVMFDGLDEVNQEGGLRDRVITDLSNFSKQYYASQCLITCRIAASEYAFEQFQDVEIADFTDDQVRSFIDKWFQDNPEKLKAFKNEFYKKENEPIRELGNVPLLLSLICLAFEDNMSFPQRRADLYEEALDALLRRWDTSRNIRRDEIYKNLSLRLKQHMFAHIAADTFGQGINFIPQRDLEKQIVSYLEKLSVIDTKAGVDGRAVLKTIEAQHSIFVERAKGIYTFSHLTFQEYYVAKYCAENEAGGTVERLIKNHLVDSRWREVFLLTATQLDKADQFFWLFREGIDGLMAGEERLVELLRWAGGKAEAVKTPYKAVALRGAYLYLALALTLDLARALDRALDRVLALARAYALDLDLALARDLDRALAHAQAQALDLDFGVDLRLFFVLRIAATIHSIRSLDISLNETGKVAAYFTEVIDQISQQDATTALTQALRGLTMPGENAPVADWEQFITDLRVLVQTHRDIGHEWKLTGHQLAQLAAYSEANLLLLECLKVAGYVSNREEIENSLLLPPK